VCRVRHHDSLAKVEVAFEDLGRALEPDMHETIVRELRAAGYESVVIDPKGYRTGSLNEGLILRQV
jgi:pyridinium-3,5-biscarboxylic acid mononucleotide sulfurtransferase